VSGSLIAIDADGNAIRFLVCIERLLRCRRNPAKFDSEA
jgi:hypothetical protein